MASDARRIHAESLKTPTQPRTDGVHPIDGESALKPPPIKKSVVPVFNPGNHSTFRFLPHPSNLHLEMPPSFSYEYALTELFFPFFNTNEIQLMKTCLQVRCVTRARPSARERSSGRTRQQHCLPSGTQQSSMFDKPQGRRLPRSRAMDHSIHPGDAPSSSSTTSH